MGWVQWELPWWFATYRNFRKTLNPIHLINWDPIFAVNLKSRLLQIYTQST